VDDAIVMLENITRYIEKGERPMVAAYKAPARSASPIVLDQRLVDRRPDTAAPDGRHQSDDCSANSR